MEGQASGFRRRPGRARAYSLPMFVTELAGDFVPSALPIVKGPCDVGEDFEDSNQSPDAALAQVARDKSRSVCHRVTYNEQSAVPLQLASPWQAPMSRRPRMLQSDIGEE